MQISTKSIFAKILANEDIEVLESSYLNTAAFDLEKRRLLLPIWKDVSDQLSRMLLGHEVSHALHTPSAGWFSAIESKPADHQKYFKNILNVVEDVRIDGLIMTRYPGLKSDYRFAMRELRERGFFGEDFGQGKFLSRLNTHLKYNVSGQNTEAIIFDSLESPLVKKAIAVQSWEDVVAVSEEIYALFPYDPLFVFDIQTGYSKDLSDCDCNPIDPADVDIDEETQNVEGETFQFPPNGVFKNHIMPMRADYMESAMLIPDKRNVQKLRTIFNRKKAAMKLRERRYRKTGNIDTNSLHRYKPTGEIFSKELLSQREKNHCIIVLVDGSASMKYSMKAVSQKVFEIYEFCRLEKIPFMCYQFKEAEGYLPNIRKAKGGYRLYQYYHIKRTPAIDMTAMANSAQGGTPYCDSLLAMFPIMDDIRKKYRDSNISLISMTDGACNSTGTIYQNYVHPVYKTLMKPEPSCRNVWDSSAPIYRTLRDIYDCRVISFFLNHQEGGGIQTFYEKGGTNVHYDIEIKKLGVSNSPEETKILESFIETIS